MPEIECPNCRGKIRFGLSAAGRLIDCPHPSCGKQMKLPPVAAPASIDVQVQADNDWRKRLGVRPKSANVPTTRLAADYGGTLLVLNGRQGKSVVVQGATVKIIKKGWALASQREKTLPIRNISSVEVKKPGAMIAGFIQFSIAGGIAREGSFTFTGGAFDAVQDENSVVFSDNASYLVALRIKEYVETYGDRAATPSSPTISSVADEIAKFKALMDQGVISEDEFERKKRQLLDL